jgi:membrane protease YdiL (CAAX protease family)
MFISVALERSRSDLFSIGTSAVVREHLFYWSLLLAFASALTCFCYRVDSKENSLLFGRWHVPVAFYVYAVLSAIAIRIAQILLSKGRGDRYDVNQPDWFLDQVGRTPGGIVLAVLFIATMAPIVEELIFRRGIYRVFALVRPWVGLIGSSIIFAAVHPTGLRGSAFLVGIVTGYLYQRSASVLPSVLCHAAFNLSGLVVAIAAS